MKKALICALIYAIIWMVTSAILQLIAGNSEWLGLSLNGGVTAFFATLAGYNTAKSDKD